MRKNQDASNRRISSAKSKHINGVPPWQLKKKVPLGGLIEGNPPLVGGNHPDFNYQGGPIIKDPQVYTIYFGDAWGGAPSTRTNRLDQFISDLMNSQYMNMLAQYGVGSTGNFIRSVFIGNSNHTLLRADIDNMLQNAINTNVIPEPDNPSNAYIIYLDDNTGIDDVPTGSVMCEASSDSAFGFHDVYT